ncbi:DUF7657 domain-containing protein [Cupriavidus alkaliphilus]|uniref:DUF7657 domain-containing protein n=1 Tax=Cupriavidus alkaliphilus TaxID=942866 RepID=UPI0008159E91|nr:hypothetical protein [Cupriavidus alkaliphilus]SCB08924.1 hypothetical protein GA0116996_101400 [Cupriavidus alkaliphilus]
MLPFALIRKYLVWFVLLSLGAIYVGNTWSPSSYGVVLERIGAQGEGLHFGKPRAVRSDEWSVVTPLTQATVRNGLQRFNATSLYQEDLRINYGMPIADWGLIFKPTMWLYPLVNAAYAFSFHWFAIFAVFIVGYSKLFRVAGATQPQSYLLALTLYFTGFSQFWWNEKGPIIALFAGALAVLFIEAPIVVRVALFYWLATSWLMTNFYPPLFISLAFAGVVFLLCYGREWWRPARLASLAGTSLLAAATVVLYLKEYLLRTMQTLYPGQRNFSGGALPVERWLSQFFPASSFDRSYNSLIGANVSEIGVVGTWFVVLCLCFLDYRNLRNALAARRQWVPVAVLFAALALVTSWMMLPVPAVLGKPLLWNHVQPERMVFAAGLLLVLFALAVVRVTGLAWSTKRALIFIGVTIASWLLFKASRYGFHPRYWNDLYVVPAVLLCSFIQKVRSLQPLTSISGLAAFGGATMFFPFNPVQSAWPIFNVPDTVILQQLTRQAQANDGVLAAYGFSGATLNGLGYRSASHVTPVPSLTMWRQCFAALPVSRVDSIFNRYSHITLIDSEMPILLGPDNVGVPRYLFSFSGSGSRPGKFPMSAKPQSNGVGQL